MCGIVGFTDSSIDYDKEEVIRSMMHSIKHRGPDDEGVFLANNNSTAFGHVRLSIIDIQSGQQPMISDDGRFTIVFNGELYNYIELREDLRKEGFSFRTNSDTEVLLKMYMHFGEDMLQKLNGMFSFAIYDLELEQTFIARDHLGVKPLYYYKEDNFFAFASEIKALFYHPKIKAESNEDLLHEYLTYQFILGKETLFRNIFKLEPGNFAVIERGQLIRIQEYWQVSYEIDEQKTEDDFAQNILEILHDSARLQIRSDVPLGAFLSGGIDSSLVSTLASHYYDGTLKTFTGGFKIAPEYDESAYARIVSEAIGSEHFEYFPEANEFIESFEKLVYHMDEPAAGPGLFPQYMISKLAAQHVKVVLGGQGGDEIFGGYARYSVAYLEQCLKGAIFESQEEGNHVVTLGSIIESLPMLKNYFPMIRNQFRSGLFEDMDKRYFRLVNRAPNLPIYYSEEFLNHRSEGNIATKFEAIFNKPDTSSYFNKMTYFDMKSLLPALFHVEDRVSMSVSLESRVPLCDYRLVELAASIPPTIKYAGGKTKYMLIKSIQEILPKEIINRKDKMGFPTPLNQWTKGPLKEYILDTIKSKAARERGLYRVDEIEKQMLKSPKFSRDLWGLINIEQWHRTFID
ncbi:MAG: asparagine synthase (glutamine-hydrolyzing) [Bacteroidota bacterium]